MYWMADGALKKAIAQPDPLNEHIDSQQANVGLSGAPGVSENMADGSRRLEPLPPLDAIRHALDGQRWREALELLDRRPSGDAAAEPMRQEASHGMAEFLLREATTAEAKADWATALTLLREAQAYDISNATLAARITEDERVLAWSTALGASLLAWQSAQAQQDVTANLAPSLASDDADQIHESDEEESDERAPRRIWLVAAVGAVLLMVGFGAMLAMSGGGVLASVVHSPTPTRIAQPAIAGKQATATATTMPTLFVTATPAALSAPPATATSTATASATRTQTPVASPTAIATATPTQTATFQPTDTPSPTGTPVPTNTPTPTGIAQPTAPLPTNTAQPATPPPTNTAQPTTPPPTNTPRPANTPVPTALPTRQPILPTPTPAF